MRFQRCIPALVSAVLLGGSAGCLINVDSSSSSITDNQTEVVGCGDGVLDAWEACDDGNRFFGDGCSDSCERELWTTLGADPDPAGDAGNMPFDLANIQYAWSEATQRLYLGVQSHQPGDLRDFGVGFMIAPSETSCIYAAIVAYFADTVPLSFWSICEGETDWSAASDPPSLEASAGSNTRSDFIAVRFDPREIDADAMADGSAFAAAEVFDDDDSDLYPDTGFMVPFVWTASGCGNGLVESPEECDDGDTIPGDGCSALCQIETACGNTILDPGETCDDGGNTPGDGCSASCQLESVCGNGELEPGEECDDNNPWSGDGCSSACQIEKQCGNGVVESGETCDDGNSAPGDGCSATCQREPACGNGFLDAGEECDDGNDAPGDGCSGLCEIEPYCGNGMVDAGELCDDGFHDLCGSCNANCSGPGFGSTCGDFQLCPETEACDDGNTEDGDACPADCGA